MCVCVLGLESRDAFRTATRCALPSPQREGIIVSYLAGTMGGRIVQSTCVCVCAHYVC